MRQNSESGFTLIEVMIALAIFSVFISVYVTSQGFNIADSASFKQELKLKDLTSLKINEIITSPPELNEQLTLSPETADFEDYPNYSYEITYQKFIIPDFSKIKGDEQDLQDRNEQAQMEEIQERIFETVKNNMELLLWQIEVRVVDKTTEESYSATTWLYNEKAAVKMGGF